MGKCIETDATLQEKKREPILEEEGKRSTLRMNNLGR
jgi:hypothetical protein